MKNNINKVHIFSVIIMLVSSMIITLFIGFIFLNKNVNDTLINNTAAQYDLCNEKINGNYPVPVPEDLAEVITSLTELQKQGLVSMQNGSDISELNKLANPNIKYNPIIILASNNNTEILMTLFVLLSLYNNNPDVEIITNNISESYINGKWVKSENSVFFNHHLRVKNNSDIDVKFPRIISLIPSIEKLDIEKSLDPKSNITNGYYNTNLDMHREDILFSLSADMFNLGWRYRINSIIHNSTNIIVEDLLKLGVNSYIVELYCQGTGIGTPPISIFSAKNNSYTYRSDLILTLYELNDSLNIINITDSKHPVSIAPNLVLASVNSKAYSLGYRYFINGKLISSSSLTVKDLIPNKSNKLELLGPPVFATHNNLGKVGFVDGLLMDNEIPRLKDVASFINNFTQGDNSLFGYLSSGGKDSKTVFLGVTDGKFNVESMIQEYNYTSNNNFQYYVKKTYLDSYNNIVQDNSYSECTDINYDGEYKIIINDRYNQSLTLVFYYLTNINGINQFDITNENFIKSEYYEVDLSNTIGNNVFSIPTGEYRGVYNTYKQYWFSSPVTANIFAVASEYARNVTLQSSGTYSYKTTNNNIINNLTKEQLTLHINNRIKKGEYVSNKKIYKASNKGTIPTDVVVLDSSLLINTEGRAFVSKEYKFSPINVSSYTGHSIAIISRVAVYLNDVLLIQNALSSNMSLYDQLGGGGEYTIYEYNARGNSYVSYQITIDNTVPQLSVTYNVGDGSGQIININTSIVGGEQIYAIDFAFKNLIDIDKYSYIEIIGEKHDFFNNIYTGKYLALNKLKLTSVNGKGDKYTIIAYDRTGNKMEFVVNIAGAPPQLESNEFGYQSEKIVEINIFKLGNILTNVTASLNGVEILEDMNGNSIFELSVGSLLTFTQGGNYTFKVYDNFGRITELVYKFEKNMPSLSINIRGEETNKDVIITAPKNAIVEIRHKSFGSSEYTIISIPGIEYGINKKYNISAILENNGHYTVKVWFIDDVNNFNSTAFNIDTVAPKITFYQGTINNPIEVPAGSKIGSEFWGEAESYSEMYYVYNKEKYSYRGSKLNQAGNYLFTITDNLGNKNNYDIEIDNIIEYDIIYLNNKYIESQETISGVLLTIVSGFNILIHEQAEVRVELNGVDVLFDGSMFTEEGDYLVYITDVLNNKTTSAYRVVKTVTGYSVKAGGQIIDSGAKIKGNFVIEKSDTSILRKAIIYNKNNEYDVEFGREYVFDGVCTIRFIDELDNYFNFTLEVDNIVDYYIDGNSIIIDEVINNQQIYLYDAFSIHLNESATVAVYFENELQGQDSSYIKNGLYRIEITDALDNISIVNLRVYNKLVGFNILAENGVIITTDIINIGFAMTYNIDSYVKTIKYKRNDTKYYSYSKDEIISLAGYYEILIIDILNNEHKHNITIDTLVAYDVHYDNEFVTKEYYINTNIAKILTKGITITSLENIKVNIIDAQGNNVDYIIGSQLRDNGVYFVTLYDDVENISYLYIEIRNTVAYVDFPDQATINIDLLISFGLRSYIDSSTYSFNSGRIHQYNSGQEISLEGSYQFVFIDKLNNVLTLNYNIDKSVNYELLGNLFDRELDNDYVNFSYFANQLKIVAHEELEIVVKFNGIVIPYTSGEVITDYGEYEASIKDNLNNKVTLSIAIMQLNSLVEAINENGEKINDYTKYAFSLRFESDYIKSVMLNGVNYNSNLITKQGKYSFTVISVLDEIKEIHIVYDNIVEYEILGRLIKSDSNNCDWFSSSFKINLLELGVIEVTKNGQLVDSNYDITEHGYYKVSINDNYYNNITIVILVDNKKPLLTISEEEITNKDVTFKIEDDANIADIIVKKDGKSFDIKFINFTAVFTEHGKYLVIVADILGNESSIEFIIDKIVKFTINVPANSYTNTDISIVLDEDATVIITKDNMPYVYEKGGWIVESGEYIISITDRLNNNIKYNINKLIKHKTYKSFALNIDDEMVIIKDGALFEVPLGEYILNEPGNYNIECSHDFEVIIDSIAPVVEFDNIISDKGTLINKFYLVSKETNVDYKLFYQDMEVDIEKSHNLLGNYKLIAVDLAGNTTIVEFQLIHKYNLVSIILLVILGALIVSFISYIIYQYSYRGFFSVKFKKKRSKNS